MEQTDFLVFFENYLKSLPDLRSDLDTMKDLVLTNIVFLGEIPALATTSYDDILLDKSDYNLRAKFFSERLIELGVDDCSADDAGNPVGILKGTDSSQPPIIIAAHLDSYYGSPGEIHFSITEDSISGLAVLDNAVGAGIVLSLPEIIRKLGLSFSSDLMLVGFAGQRPGGDQPDVRKFLENLSTPVRGAIIVEGADLGRLNYYSSAMVRLDIRLDAYDQGGGENPSGVSVIILLAEIIDRILAIEIPQKPLTRINFGRISGGYKYGEPALQASLGLEIRSSDDAVVERISQTIRDIVESFRYEYGVDARISRVGGAAAATLGFSHPLVKSATAIMHSLYIEPKVFSNESELSAFLAHGIPAVAIGITNGEDHHLSTAKASISAMRDGIAQLIALITAIDKGVCDGNE